ncbi:MAG: hypothetical protein EA382_18260 [Spirochaetaceae bacterium]|nr:MAG: hypothetical protein EA382_18260 [Spirochaetaceae bacterium]
MNGRRVHEGPPKSHPFMTYYDQVPVGAMLEPGDNVICAIVNHVGYDDDSRGGFLAELIDADGTALAATGPAWRAIRSPAWRQDSFFCFFNRVVPYQEHFDARRLPVDWLLPRFDDSRWEEATVISHRGRTRPPQVPPWTRLIPRDIPIMTEQPLRAERVAGTGESTSAMNRMRGGDLSISLSQPGVPIARAAIDDPDAICAEERPTVFACSTAHRSDPGTPIMEPWIVLDFGRIINAYAEIDVDGPAGATLEIGYAERLTDGQFNNVIEGQFADGYTLREGAQSWRSFAWKSFRYVKIRVKNAFAPLILRDFRAIESAYPFDDVGSFETPDRQLQSVYDICRATTQIACNEYITDTPWREQGQWLGDVAAVTLGSIYACFGDTALARKFLIQSAATQYPTGFLGNMTNTYTANWSGVLPDFSLWWLMALRDFYVYTGDESIVVELYHTAARLITANLAYRRADGLIEDAPYEVFIDWANVDRTGASAAYNALLYGALVAMEELAGAYGDERMERTCRAATETIRTSFRHVFWDPDEHLFADAVDGTQATGAFSEQTNAAAIEFGLADDAQRDAIIDRLWARGDAFLCGTNNGVTEANPFFTAVVLKALARAGRHDLALDVIRDRWGKRMVAHGATSTYEEWSRYGSWRNGDELVPIMRTESHAWSAFPARWLPEYLCGITIVEPGCAQVRITAADVDLDYRAVFPTPRGAITVTCSAGATTIDTPTGVTVMEGGGNAS